MKGLSKLRRYVTLEIRDEDEEENNFDLRVRLASATEAMQMIRSVDEATGDLDALELMLDVVQPHLAALDGETISTDEERGEVATALTTEILSEVFRAVVGKSDTVTIGRRGKSTSGPS